MNNKILDALRCQNEASSPLWLMRQAGRYLPEFRKLRKQYSFMELCRKPELAAEVTLMPLKRFDFDAAILFCDILVVAEVLGVGLHFKEGIGPVIECPIRQISDLTNLTIRPVDEVLEYVRQAIKYLKPNLKVPLLGFCGAPFTVASYLIEGGQSDSLSLTKRWIFKDPEGFHRLMDLLSDITIEYLKMQIKAGVDAIQIFDTWANHLAFPQFMEFCLPYLKKILHGIGETHPVILFSKGSAQFYREMITLKPAALSLDWSCDIHSIAKSLPKGVAVQGNLDPDILFAPKERLVFHIKQLLKGMDGHKGYIFNLGHGIKPDTPLESVYTLVETVKGY